ncbi:MAG TPA: response regulator [Burkholderiales bacterium]|jgi:CheY-like chemotaxis protein|nr:response regulator [Burkholderiales bacterium]
MPTQPLRRICCVEDDDDIRRIVRLSLERIGGMTVDLVADPAVAIDSMIAFRPDLVMLDWMMPGIDGPALLRKMREVPETRALPVVFITAKASQRELAELSALGAAGTISKPFAPKDLPGQLRAIWNALP